MKRFLFLFLSIFLFAFADDSLMYDNKGSKYDRTIYDGESERHDKSQTAGEIETNKHNEGIKDWSVVCPKSDGNCSGIFNNAINSWKNTTKELLDNLLKEWENSNTELENNIEYVKELVTTQVKELTLQQEKVLRLQEISFNLQKAVDLNVPNIEILQTKQKLNKNILTK